MVVFHSYVELPEGTQLVHVTVAVTNFALHVTCTRSPNFLAVCTCHTETHQAIKGQQNPKLSQDCQRFPPKTEPSKTRYDRVQIPPLAYQIYHPIDSLRLPTAFSAGFSASRTSMCVAVAPATTHEMAARKTSPHSTRIRLGSHTHLLHVWNIYHN